MLSGVMPDDLVNNPDPSTQVLDALWDALEASLAVTSRVKLMNRDKRMGDLAERQRRPDGDATEDRFPSAMILPAGGLINLTGSSSGIEAQQNFELLLASADARVDRGYFPLYWAILAAMAKAHRTTGGHLGLPFVIGVALRNYTAEENAQAILQGLTGWSSFITIEVRMRIRHDAIIATA